MDLTINAETLKVALEALTPALATKSTLPVLKAVRLDAHGGLLRLVATNLELTIRQECGAMVLADGALCVPGQEFRQIVGYLEPTAPLALTTEGQRLTVRSGRFSAKLSGWPAEDYPERELGDATEGDGLQVVATDLARGLEQAVIAVATDRTRPTLGGLCLTVTEGTLRLQGADGFWATQTTVPLVAAAATLKDRRIVIPRESVKALTALLAKAKGTVEVRLGATSASFVWGETTLASRTIEGMYPDFGQIFPSAQPLVWTVKRTELLRAAQLGKDVGENQILRLERRPSPEETTAQVICSSEEDGRSFEDPVSVTVTGEDQPLRVALSARFLVPALGAFEADRVMLGVRSPTTPVLVWASDDVAEHKTLIMPMHIAGTKGS